MKGASRWNISDFFPLSVYDFITDREKYKTNNVSGSLQSDSVISPA